MNRNIFEKLVQCAKKRIAVDFIRLAHQSQLPSLIPQLEDGQLIKVMNFYKNLRINEPKSWKIMETTYLSRNFTSLTFSEYTNIVYCFSKNSYNPELWKSLEVEIIKRMIEFKKDLLFTPESMEKSKLGVVMHSFSRAHYYSETLWTEFENVIKDCWHLLTQKNIGMIIISYESYPKKDEKVIEVLEKAALLRSKEVSRQNLLVICYNMAKMNKGSPAFWIKWEQMLSPLLNELSPKDLSQILWCFSRVKKGSDTFWSQIEQVTIKNCINFGLIDFNNAIYSFLLNKTKNPKVWQEFQNYIKIKYSNFLPEKKTSHGFSELLFVSHVFEQVECKDEKCWEKLGLIYSEYIKSPEAVMNAPVKFNYHLGILRNNKKLWNENLESLFKEILCAHNKNIIYLKFLIDLVYLAFKINEPVSEDFFRFLVGKLLEIDYEALSQDTVRDTSGVAALFCLFLSRYSKKKKKEYEDIIAYITKPQNVDTFVKNGKAFSLLLKFFSNNVEDQRFWKAYCQYFINFKKNQFPINIISNLTIAVLERNKFGFIYDMHLLLNKKYEAILYNDKMRYEKTLEILARILLEDRKFQDVKEIQNALEMPELTLNQFIKTYEKKIESVEDYQQDEEEIKRNI